MTAEKAQLYRLLLHNDELNSMEYVVETILKTIPEITEPQAVNAMMEAHHCNVGAIFTCELEKAKLYCNTFCDRGLNVTIEPFVTS